MDDQKKYTVPQENAPPTVQSPEANETTDSELVTSDPVPTQNSQSNSPKVTKRFKTLIIAPTVIGLVVFSYIGYQVVDLSLFCHHKTHKANNEANQQSEQLSNIILFNTKPRISTSTDDDCIDGDGTGTAEASYDVNDLSLNQVNSEVLASLQGKEMALSMNDSGDNNDSMYSENNSTSIINELLTTITTPNGKSYAVQFKLANRHTCDPTCETGKNIVQELNLQSAPIQSVYVEVN